MKLSDVQVRWQSAALKVLMTKASDYDYGPWIPASDVVGAIEAEASCTYQAANGALKALLMVGLADRSETNEGHFWKATDAAERAYDLLIGPLKDELDAIERRLVGIDTGLDQILWMQERRGALEAKAKP